MILANHLVKDLEITSDEKFVSGVQAKRVMADLSSKNLNSEIDLMIPPHFTLAADANVSTDDDEESSAGGSKSHDSGAAMDESTDPSHPTQAASPKHYPPQTQRRGSF